MIGGDGERRTLRAVAEHADWWNTVMRPVAVLQHKIDVLRAHCHAIGRDPATVRKSLTRIVYLAPTRAEAEQRAGHRLAEEVPPFAGEPAALVDHLRELIELGFDVFQLVFAGFPETADLRLFADRVLPAFDAELSAPNPY
jgi:alkanesulfonate monooxygenase SsuD/methylene tetrahydromethanopterin reductase-like flavin-dependent oxidoreductase (luciferase family)